MISMPGRSWTGALDPLDAADRDLASRLRANVTFIASAEHNMAHPDAYEAAAKHLEAQLAEAGHAVRRQEFRVDGKRVRNLDVEIAGSDAGAGIVVIGAHYDSVHGAPGANDNGSGTAATVELARLFAGWKPVHTWRLVLFANEEPPHFKTESMGSAVYARACKARGERIAAMFSLETMGYYSEGAGSQRYPFPLNYAYPDRGNFIAFVGNVASRGLVRRAVGTFREKARFPSEGVAAPQIVPGIDWSDHWAFWREDWPALMITDTAPFRYPHYHTAQDTPDKIDYERLARVVRGLDATFRALDGTIGR
ncbi:MAG: M28 family peptidase [Burkholderiales bacterium]|nr:M28 family peptidase [Burkholderiales bacterium]